MNSIFAAVVHDFTLITGELETLALALLVVASLVLVSGLVIFGVFRGWDALAGMFRSVSEDDEWRDHPLNPRNKQ